MIYRIDIRTTPTPREGHLVDDAVGESIRHQIQEFGTRVGCISTARIFLIETDADRSQVQNAATELLADPIVESAELVLEAPVHAGKSRIEIHLKPDVMDPVPP